MNEAVLTAQQASFKDYVNLCKPRVVALMIVTSLVAMFLATPTGMVPWHVLVFGNLGIFFAACAGGAINQILDRRIDLIMARTKGRPLPSGRVKTANAIIMSAVLAIASMLILVMFVNVVAAVLSLATLIGYAIVYTVYLKRATPQNIVIGGLAGAMPPLLGWACVTGSVTGGALLLVLIIFAWTPPHFWALAIHRHEEYKKADIPMLPVTHGIPYTKLNIVLYTMIMTAVSYLSFVIDMCGLIYAAGISILNGVFIYNAFRLSRTKQGSREESLFAWKTFRFSIIYLAWLFVVLLVDHFVLILT